MLAILPTVDSCESAPMPAPKLRGSAASAPRHPISKRDGSRPERVHHFELSRFRFAATLERVSDVTRILVAAQNGDPTAADQLLPLVYEELRKLAAVRMAQEK